jgi:hypothetical protein
MVEQERLAGSPAGAWTDYFAEFFVDRYGAWPVTCRAAPRM